jgi:hypothetical protein
VLSAINLLNKSKRKYSTEADEDDVNLGFGVVYSVSQKHPVSTFRTEAIVP